VSDQGQINAKREAAARARRLALQLASEPDRARAMEFAAELDAEADAMERAIPPPAPQVTQIQMQVQQAPPLKDDGDKKDEGGKDGS
jgi:hypothetical protein